MAPVINRIDCAAGGSQEPPAYFNTQTACKCGPQKIKRPEQNKK